MICRIIRWLAARYCQDMIWNRDISLEVDRLIDENDRLRERIKWLEALRD